MQPTTVHLATVALASQILVIGCSAETNPGVPGESISASRLHDEAIVIDGHVHLVSRLFHEGIDPWQKQETGLFDLARARQGGLDVVIHNIYVEDAYNRYNYTVKQACRLIEQFYRLLDKHPDKMALALNSSDVRGIVAQGKMAQILGLEGGFDMEGDLDVLRLFHRLGVRMIQMVNHRTTNAFADAYASEQKWNGINDLGRAIIREMNRLGIMIDISHATDTAQLQIIEASRAPVIANHVGVQQLSDHPQNLTDRTIRALAAKGGVIGVHGHGAMLAQKYWDWRQRHEVEIGAVSWKGHWEKLTRPPGNDGGEYVARIDTELTDRWVRGPRVWYGTPWKKTVPEGAPQPTVEDYVRVIDYIVNLVGEDHAAIGLDLMWGKYWLKDFDATSYPSLTEAFLRQGYSPQRIRKILGENWLRVLDAAKVP